MWFILYKIILIDILINNSKHFSKLESNFTNWAKAAENFRPSVSIRIKLEPHYILHQIQAKTMYVCTIYIIDLKEVYGKSKKFVFDFPPEKVFCSAQSMILHEKYRLLFVCHTKLWCKQGGIRGWQCPPSLVFPSYFLFTGWGGGVIWIEFSRCKRVCPSPDPPA